MYRKYTIKTITDITKVMHMYFIKFLLFLGKQTNINNTEISIVINDEIPTNIKYFTGKTCNQNNSFPLLRNSKIKAYINISKLPACIKKDIQLIYFKVK